MIKLDDQIRENKILYLTVRPFPILKKVGKSSLVMLNELVRSQAEYNVKTF